MGLNLELNYCVEKAKEVLLSLNYPCSDLVTPVERALRELLRPGLSGAAKPFADDFLNYVKSLELHLSESESGEEDKKEAPNVFLAKLREVKPEDFIAYLSNKNYSSSNLLGRLLQECS